ncbi:MAG: hypothetical protein L0206_25535 [Actinobacteria bacterium]|nr:hypothetical protein [Actinomycetota bacterium]
MDLLVRIKRLVVRGAVRFTEKARVELERDGLDPEEALEAILSAHGISKTLRSRSSSRRTPGERLYVIVGVSFSGVPIYTKGTIRREGGRDVLYILVSSKRSIA